MVNYNDIIIYKLCCKNPEITDIYVGHTCNFTRRKYEHKFHCNNEHSEKYNYNVYTFIRDNGGWNNFDMVMVEQYPCENKLESERRERHWIETLNATLNCVIPSRTHEEIQKYGKRHRIENKEYYKKYGEDHRDHILEQKKKYYIDNVEKFKKYRSQKIECECGCEITRGNILSHKKSNKHLELMKLKETES